MPGFVMAVEPRVGSSPGSVSINMDDRAAINLLYALEESRRWEEVNHFADRLRETLRAAGYPLDPR